MIRKTDIKRLWDVLMILKQEEDIDDVRKRARSEQYTDANQAAVAAKIGASALKDKEFQEEQAKKNREQDATRTSLTAGTVYPPSRSSDIPDVDRPSDPPAPATGMLADWERRTSSETASPSASSAASPGEAMLTEWKGRKDPVKSAGGGMHPGGGAYSKSLKKSNESKVLRIFRKYGF